MYLKWAGSCYIIAEHYGYSTTVYIYTGGICVRLAGPVATLRFSRLHVFVRLSTVLHVHKHVVAKMTINWRSVLIVVLRITREVQRHDRNYGSLEGGASTII